MRRGRDIWQDAPARKRGEVILDDALRLCEASEATFLNVRGFLVDRGKQRTSPG
jgi:hypothetical protein